MAMDISSVVQTNSAGTTAGVGLSGMRSDDFMTILIKQLQYQDPLKPMGNEEMLAQIANIRELEMNTRLSSRLEQLTDQQRFGSAAALMGKFVRGEISDDAGNVYALEGIVTGVRFNSNGEAILELDTGDVMPMAALTQVTNEEVVSQE